MILRPEYRTTYTPPPDDGGTALPDSFV